MIPDQIATIKEVFPKPSCPCASFLGSGTRCEAARFCKKAKRMQTLNSSCKRQISSLNSGYVSCDIVCSNFLCAVNPCGKCGRELLFSFSFLLSLSSRRPEILSLSFGKLKLRCKCSCKRLRHLPSEKYAKTDGMVLHNIKACAG